MKLLFLAFLFIYADLAFAQNAEHQNLDNYFSRFETKGRAMGSFAISENGKTVYQRAFGYASLEPEVDTDTARVYQIGSVSKTFTAALILQMVDEGKLALQTKLLRFFPKWPKADRISIEDLLRHRSGIHNFGEDRSGKYRDVHPHNRQEVLEIFENAELDFEPGSRAEYNNANYMVLSLIAEEIDSTPFAEILQNRIVVPLGLKRTGLGGSTEFANNEVHSYYQKGKKWKRVPEGDLNSLKGAGAVVSTASDVNRFLEALFRQQLFSSELLDEMKTMQDGFGLGLFRYPFYNKTCFGHAGSIGSFQSMAAYFPNEGVSFTLCLNAGGEHMNEIVKEALAIYFDQ